MDQTSTRPETKGRSGNKKGFFRWFARNRRIQVIFILIILSVPAFLLVYGILLPVKNYKPSLNAVNAPDTASFGSVSLNDQQAGEVRDIIRKENEKAFQQARLSLAEKDSIYVVLNLPDSLLQLEIKGVAVKKARFLDMEVSNRLSLITHENLLPWISEPFTLERDLSTIPKDPIVVKQAPKDTIEAAKQSSKPGPPDSTNVYYTLYFDRNLVVEVEQADPLEKWTTEKVETYLKIKRKESHPSVLELLQNPQQEDQPVRVRLVLSEPEARAIYRAFSINTKMILKL